MSTLQEPPTPALVIHRYGLRKVCVLPAGVEPDDARGKYLCIGTRKQCEGYVNERQALAEARAAAQLQQPNGQVPAADPENYAARVRQAYQQLAGERRNPDVPIVDLYQRVGASWRHFTGSSSRRPTRAAPYRPRVNQRWPAAKRSLPPSCYGVSSI